MWVTQLPKNTRNYNVYCDAALQDLFGPYKEARNHQKTQGIIRFIAIWALQGNPAARHHQKT